jgi:LPS-assembly protein
LRCVTTGILLRLFLLISLLWLSSAWGQEPEAAPSGATSNWGECKINAPPPLTDAENDVPDDELDIASGRVEFTLEGDATFTDQIVMRSGNRILRADGAEYDSKTGTFVIAGDVEFRDPETTIKASNAELSQINESVKFETAEFELLAVPARGSAGQVKVEGAGRLYLEDAAYTSCPVGQDDWMLRASSIEINQETGVGTARHARLKLKGVPIFYFPRISYPVSNQRKTGWLMPDFGTNSNRGVEAAVPFYWNISPKYDATFTPRYMSKRGLQAQTNFRYLAKNTDGEWSGDYLADDNVTATDRWLYAWFNQTSFYSDWRATVDVIGVSDSNYFEDMAGTLASTSQTNLRRHMEIEFYNDIWSGLLQVQDYQTIDDSITALDEPYTTLPQLDIRGYSPRGLFGLEYELSANVTNFDREVGVTGLRGRLRPEVGFPVDTKFVEIKPTIGLEHVRYDLHDTLPGENDTPTMTAPVLGLDLNSVFERYTNKQGWIQTLEPRVLYAYIPFRDQNDLPVFDTITPDLNVVQLYRKNRFVGYDRLGDTNQISGGLSTRLFDSADGDEFMRATVGAIRYLGDRRVTLPGGMPSDSNTSDYLAEFGMKLFGNWRTRLGFQWDSDQSESELAETRLLYQSGESKIANFSYRYRRDILEEVDVAVAWPLPGQFNVIGRYDYSLQDKTTLESLLGLEYETCCWAIRGNWRRYLASRDGNLDNSFGIQLILKGFGTPDSAAERLLDRGILGYD